VCPTGIAAASFPELFNAVVSGVLTCDPELEARIFESNPLNVRSNVRRVRRPLLAIRGFLRRIHPKETRGF
jgi:hypothetical protein